MEFLRIIRDTPLPTILVVGGIALLLLSVLSQVGGWIKVPPQRQKAAGIFGIVVLAFGIILYLVPASPPPGPSTTPIALSSYFDGTSTDEWTSTDNSTLNPGNGFLEAAPKNDNKTSYYVAPTKYHGDWSSYSFLKFDLKSSKGEYYKSGHDSYGDVYIASNQMSAQRSFTIRPSANWHKYIIPLKDDGNWTLSRNAKSIDDILTNVTDFQVRAEYAVGTDSSGLDNVELEKRR